MREDYSFCSYIVDKLSFYGRMSYVSYMLGFYSSWNILFYNCG